jgi:hypothetical protein
MKWDINCNLWDDEAANNHISKVIQQIADHFVELVPNVPPTGFKPIMIIHDPFFDHRIYTPLEESGYKIGIHSGQETFSKAANDFAHELMHIYCDPRVINWFTEIICHTASLYFLDFLTSNWIDDPKDKELREYAGTFDERKNEITRNVYQNVDMYQHQNSGNWIREEIKKVAEWTTHGDDILYNAIALEILPIFSDSPEAWKIVSYIGQSALPLPPEDPKNLTQQPNTQPDFYTFLHLLPEHLKSFGEKLVNKIWTE